VSDEGGVMPHELGAFFGEGSARSVVAEGADGGAEFAVGKAADHRYGVLYQGPWETLSDGTSRAVRLHSSALAATGIPVFLQSFTNTIVNEQGFPEPVHEASISDVVRAEVGSLPLTSIGAQSIRIKHAVLRDAQHAQQLVIPRSLNEMSFEDPEQFIKVRQQLYATTILYSVWERDRIDDEMAHVLRRVAMNWVPCRENLEMLQRAGVENVEVMPHPYRPESDLLKLRQRRPTEERRFYSIGRWEPRKGYHRLIGAFLRAFRAEDYVRLTIKHTGNRWEDYHTPESSVAAWIDDPVVRKNGWTWNNLKGKLLFVSGRLPDSVITKLHFDHNIYVACSHGEAWCLPAFDAKLAGNALIHVPYGGTRDFSDPEDVQVPFVMGPAHPSYRWVDGSAWADFSVDDLSAALRIAAPPAAYDRSRQVLNFASAAIGERMRASVLRIVRAVYPDEIYRYLSGEER
jgi:glycosyltransferase involved in cell wall biosynthesis